VGLPDTEGNTTYPVLVIIYEQLPGPAQSLEEFTRMARQRAFFPTDDIITENDRIIYFCRFTHDTSHDLVIAHFLFEGNGVQVMADAPTTVYGEVEADFQAVHRFDPFPEIQRAIARGIGRRTALQCVFRGRTCELSDGE